MKLIRRNQNQGIQPINLRDAMSRLFEQSFWDPFSWDDTFTSMQNISNQFMPKVDVSETAKEVIVKADIQGCQPEDVEIEVDNNVVILKGKTEQEKEEKDKKYYRRERSYGEFYREIPLPIEIDSSKADCEAKNGTLVITLPKKESKERKLLKVKLK